MTALRGGGFVPGPLQVPAFEVRNRVFEGFVEERSLERRDFRRALTGGVRGEVGYIIVTV
jgi:hypothetical protein